MFALYLIILVGLTYYNQHQINELRRGLQRTLQSQAEMRGSLEGLETLILQKTEKSFRMPHLRSEYYSNLDLDKGIKYQIEKKRHIVVGNIPDIVLPENITVVNPDVYYEITFYICTKMPNLPAIPIYDEYSRKPPNKSNIFNINDTTLRFVPKIFIEIKTATGDLDVFQVYNLST